MKPKLITGGAFHDFRGSVYYNNAFDLSEIRRCYLIENRDTDKLRGWQGHKIEQRWFTPVQGSFDIFIIKIDDWENPSKELDCMKFTLQGSLDLLHIPKGYISCILALEENSRLLVFADFLLGEIEDEYRYPSNYFNSIA